VVNQIETKGGSLETRNASCVNFTRQGPVWGHVQWCFELATHVDNMTVFSDGNGYCSPVKKAKRSTGDALRQKKRRSVRHWPEMHHVSSVWTSCTRALHGAACNGVLSWLHTWMVFGNRRQKSKVSSNEKVSGSLPKEGSNHTLLFTAKRERTSRSHDKWKQKHKMQLKQSAKIRLDKQNSPEMARNWLSFARLSHPTERLLSAAGKGEKISRKRDNEHKSPLECGNRSPKDRRKAEWSTRMWK